MKAPISPGNTHLSLLVVAVLVVAVQTQTTEQCTENVTVLGEGEISTTAVGKSISHGGFSKDVYLWPEEGFMGVGLQVLADTSTGPVSLDAWFPKDGLFPFTNTAAWWELGIYVYHSNEVVKFHIQRGLTLRECHYWVNTDKLLSLEVVGYGASRWRTDIPPPGCPYRAVQAPWPQPYRNCTAPPTLAPDATP
ncbi:uncharacterized protein LOC126991253 [Eriocheir sinensis]|uniref:uncharacterized protein LOC126991253 n=1 Tax=Eriocheir sinensis TaxID=95602 RepID=UPI0021C88C38|nr:uncharacterized protein LOC126991253 [Eriocheir sinensis]